MLRSRLCSLVVLISLAALPAQAADTLRIYRLDGSRQCEEGSGRSLARDAQALRRLGIRIRSMRKLQHPTMIVIMMCGAQSARANTYVIGRSDWRPAWQTAQGFRRLAKVTCHPESPAVACEIQGFTGNNREFLRKNLPPEQYQWVGVLSREFSL